MPNRSFDGGAVKSPGRPRGGECGRRQALNVLDKLLTKNDNKEKLMKALQEAFDANPFKFFKEIVIPLLPKDKDGMRSAQVNPTIYSTDSIIYQMDKATLETTIGHRLRIPIPAVTVSKGEN